MAIDSSRIILLVPRKSQRPARPKPRGLKSQLDDLGGICAFLMTTPLSNESTPSPKSLYPFMRIHRSRQIRAEERRCASLLRVRREIASRGSTQILEGVFPLKPSRSCSKHQDVDDRPVESLRLFLSHTSAPSVLVPPCISLLESQNQIIECNGQSVVYTKTK